MTHETIGGNVPDKSQIANLFAEWWQFGAWVLVGAIAFFVGRERQRYKVDEIGREVEAQGKRIEKLESQGNAEAIQLAEIVTTQGHIIHALDEIKATLKGKADK